MDFIVDDDGNEHMSDILPENYNPDCYLSRKSLDGVLNAQGRELLNLCASAQLRLLNGRYVGDTLGYMTCFNSKGSSVVDYAVASASLLPSVKYFTVKNPTFLSDHCQLVTHIKCNRDGGKKSDVYNKQDFSFQWTNFSKRLLDNELTEKHISDKILNFELKDFEKSSYGVNLANTMITDIYVNLSEKCMRKKFLKRKKKKYKSPWTDSEYLELRSMVNSLGKKIQLSPFDQSLKSKFLFLSKKLKGAAKFKKKGIQKEYFK